MVIQRIRNTISMLRNLDKATLEGIRYTILFFVVIDMVVIYWWFKLKQLGIATMTVAIMALVVVLLLERKFPPEEEKRNEDDKKKFTPVMNPIKKEPQTVETPLGFMDSLGLPNADKYNERLNEAISG